MLCINLVLGAQKTGRDEHILLNLNYFPLQGRVIPIFVAVMSVASASCIAFTYFVGSLLPTKQAGFVFSGVLTAVAFMFVMLMQALF